ncbi:MAG: hypothetical protein FD180_3478 [Planctomycetota bacterium]|nr:MAG: hypothetical protein FD180_3478 [Planctomycetota bacterium]
MPIIRSQVGGAPSPTFSVWANNFGSGSAFLGTVNASLLLFPFAPNQGVFPGQMTANTLLMGFSGSLTGTASSSSHSFSVSLGLYTLANSTQLSLLNSASTTFGTGAAATGNSSLYHGPRQLSFHSSQWSAVPAFSRTQYWMGFWMRSSNLAVPMSISGFRWMSNLFSGHLGVGNTDSSASRPFPGMGVYSVSFSSALPGSIAFSDLRHTVPMAGVIPTIVARNIGP